MDWGNSALPDHSLEETAHFRAEVAKFLAGETSAVSFRALRVPLGIYEQREDDTFVVRVRGADGVFLPQQARRVAELSERYGSGVVRISKRQDLQIHRVPSEDTQTVRAGLLEVSLASRVAGSSSIPNISSCPRAGACTDQVFDVTPYAFALSEYLRDQERAEASQRLRIAFSGCSADCGGTSVADLGFLAQEVDGVQGFAVYAAGSAGAHPAPGIKIDEFVPASGLAHVADAVKRLCEETTGGANPCRGRLRKLLDNVGPDEFQRLYRAISDRVTVIKIDSRVVRPIDGTRPPTADSGDPDYQRWKRRRVRAQPQAGLNTVLIAFAAGDVSASMLSDIAEIAECTGTVLRTTQDQDILVPNVPDSDLEEVYAALRSVCEAFVTGPSVVPAPCASATTCKLGLCLSKACATATESQQEGVPPAFEATIRLSGTKERDGDALMAPINLIGGAHLVNGRQVAFYTIVIDHGRKYDPAGEGKTVGRVPAHSVPTLLYEFWAAAEINHRDGESLDDWLDRWAIQALQSLAEKHAHVPSFEDAPEYYQAFNADGTFPTADHDSA